MISIALYIAILSILVVGAATGTTKAASEPDDLTSSRRLDDRPCVKWGAIFDVPLDGKNVLANCWSPSGKRVCCAAMDESKGRRGVGIGYDDNLKAAYGGTGKIFGDKEEVEPVGKRRLDVEFLDSSHDMHAKSAITGGKGGGCEITKEYFSSPHEQRELAEAKRISKIGASETSAEGGGHDDGSHLPTAVHDKRLKAVLDYITSEGSIKNATSWLGRVKEHMSSEQVPTGSVTDKEFLSRFEMTKTCEGKVTKKWTEWIEPMTLTTRHPFSYSTCKKIYQHFGGVPRTGRSNVDYVLLKSGKDLHQEEADDNDNNGNGNIQRKHYLLDAGTSTFESSLAWFTCAYSQRKISFDGVYAWEKTLLEPSDYWARVPPKWMPYWHFYNDAIQADEKAHNSPVRMLKAMAGPRDFVAWKLDIDHPETEMPIATSLLSDKSFSSLIDEFFFELHYRCEVMTSCGWGKRVPETHSGLILERATVMQYFIDLRKAGIRAHAWP